MIITRTPYRLSFFGGGTDYNPWFEENGGLVIAVGLAHYCYLTVRYLPPFFEHKSRVVYGKEENVINNKDIQHPSVRGCLEYMKISEGVEIHHDGDLPARSGLGSSSSFTVGVLHALYALKQQMKNPRQLAEEAIDVEQNWLKESVGIQDQIMASHGGFRIIEMGPDANWNVKNMILPKEYLKSLEDHVLLGFSGISRLSEQHAKNKVDNIKLGKTNIELQTIYALTQEALQAFQNQVGFDEIGRLLNQSWQCKRRLAEGVSTDWMDALYQTAMQKGAFGGKLMGAGGGGVFFFLAPPEKHEQIRNSLSHIKVWVPFKIDNTGSQIIFYNYN
ncbi:MAG: kinase [Deltaproteobacteria bacterium]|nr:kinase [Deltaproteobacteria bacterium]